MSWGTLWEESLFALFFLRETSRRSGLISRDDNKLLASLKLDLGYRIDEPTLAGLLSDLRTSNQVPHSLRARMKKRLREEYVSSFLQRLSGKLQRTGALAFL